MSSHQEKIAALPKAKQTNGAAGGTWFNPVDLWGSFDPPELPVGLLPNVIKPTEICVVSAFGIKYDILKASRGSSLLSFDHMNIDTAILPCAIDPSRRA
jgi:hypothetical protein